MDLSAFTDGRRDMVDAPSIRQRTRTLAPYLVVYLFACLVTVLNLFDQYGPARPVSLLESPNVPVVYYPENDPALWLYSGVRWLDRSVPYRTLWDVKPPAIHETTALLALVTGGDRSALYVASVVVALASLLVTVLLVAALVEELTDDRLAATAAGLLPLAYWRFWATPATGLYPKFLVTAFGVLAVWLFVRDRHGWAAVAATVAAWYWQPGVALPVTILAATAIAAPDRVRTVGAAIVGTSVLVLTPIAVGDALLPMVAQVFVSPLVITEGETVASHVASGVSMLRPSGVVLVGLGLLGAVLCCSRGDVRERVASVPALWFFVVAALFDLDGGVDLVPLAAFAAIPAGLGLARLSQRLAPRSDPSSVVQAVRVGGFGVVLLVTVAALPWITGEIAPFTGTWTRGGTTMLYWRGDVADVCHLRFSSMERDWIDLIGGDKRSRTCVGTEPGDLQRIWQVIVA